MRLDVLFKNFEMLADAPNGVPNLRKMILQLAIQGKLVPQDPNDLPAPRPGFWFVYALECDGGSIYIGQTKDVLKRWKEHASGKGADWTKKHSPIRLVHWEEFDSLEKAVDREKKLKTGFGRKWLKRELSAGRTRQAGEPASVLLEKIIAEKEQLLKETKIRKTKPLPPIGPDEIPFALPKGWGWERLGSIGITQTGTTPSKSNPTYFGKDISFIKPADISERSINYDNEGLSSKGLEKGRLIKENSILMVCIGGSIGKVNIIDRPCSCNQQINTLTPFQSVSHELLNYFMRSTYFQNEVVNRAPKTTLPILSKGKWELILIPLPPTKEQTRIVTKIDQLMALCDELEARKQKRDKSRIALNDAALDRLLSARKQKDFTKHWNRISNNFDLLYDNPENVNKLRQAILQLAVQGKLVPQDPNEELASVLLEKIRAEKERLIREKKIKKTKPLPPITPDEIPYELPEGWEWVKLGNLAFLLGGYAFKSNTYVPKSKNQIIRLGNVKNNQLLVRQKPAFIPDTIASQCLSYLINYEDILITMTGTKSKRDYLFTTLISRQDIGTNQLFLNQRVGILRCYNPNIAQTVNMFLKSNLLLDNLFKQATGTANQGNIGCTTINNLVFPLPPIKEQKRILTKIDRLMALCNKLEAKLSKSQSDCDELLTAIVSNIENVSTRKSQIIKNTKATAKKIEPNKIALIQEHVNTPEKKGESTSKLQIKSGKSGKKFDKLEVLRAFRKAIFRQNDIDELTLLRLTSQCLGIKRLSQLIRYELESYINTAIRRKILFRNGDGYSAGTPTIEYYDDDFLIKVLRSVTRKGWEYQREHLVEESANYLCFDKASDALKDRMKSVFRKAIRQGILYRNGLYIGKIG